jgi:site-specific DNA recombinase
LKAKCNEQINNLIAQKDAFRIIRNDISVQLNYCMGILENLSKFYENADVTGKKRILGSIFTENIFFSEKKVRTKKVNEVVSLLVNTSKTFEKIKTGQFNKNFELSRQVTPAGFEPISSEPESEILSIELRGQFLF